MCESRGVGEGHTGDRGGEGLARARRHLGNSQTRVPLSCFYDKAASAFPPLEFSRRSTLAAHRRQSWVCDKDGCTASRQPSQANRMQQRKRVVASAALPLPYWGHFERCAVAGSRRRDPAVSPTPSPVVEAECGREPMDRIAVPTRSRHNAGRAWVVHH